MAPFFDEPSLLIGADPCHVERRYLELDTAQPHLPEAVVDDDAHRVRAEAAARVLAAERNADRGVPVLWSRAPQPEAADQDGWIIQSLDREAEVIPFVRAPSRDPLLRRPFRWRHHPVRPSRHAAGVHLPPRQRRQIVLAQTTQADLLADEY